MFRKMMTRVVEELRPRPGGRFETLEAWLAASERERCCWGKLAPGELCAELAGESGLCPRHRQIAWLLSGMQYGGEYGENCRRQAAALMGDGGEESWN